MTDHEQTPLLSQESASIAPAPSQASAELTTFRAAIGINVPPSPTSSSPIDLEALRGHASGIYRTVIRTRKRYRIQYLIIDVFYYLFLLTQIAIGATLASLGPLSKIHTTAITTLGIINSTIAGILALLKGQGLPDRLRKDEFEMRKVQDFIEECESLLATVGGFDGNQIGTRDVGKLVEDVYRRYNIARDTAEMNRPASYAHQVDGDALNGNHNVRTGGPQVGAQNRIMAGSRSGSGNEREETRGLVIS